MIDFGAAIGLTLLVLCAAGIVLVAWGLRGRVVNRGPHCKACGFDLSSNQFVIDRALGKVIVEPDSEASEKAKCPECGERLTPHGSIVMGLRKKRWGMALVGTLLLLTPAVVIASAVAGVGVTATIARNAPEFLVIQLGEDRISDEFALELFDRLSTDRLSPESARALATRCLERVRTLPANEIYKAWTYQPLLEKGWITAEDLNTLIGEPQLAFAFPERSFPRRFPSLSTRVTFDSDRLPPGMSFTLENAPSDPVDMAGELRLDYGISSAEGLFIRNEGRAIAEESFMLVPENFLSGDWERQPAAFRDYRLRVNVLILCGKKVVKSIDGVRVEWRQRLIQPDEPLVELDMRPEVNQAAREYCESIRVVRVPNTAAGTQFEVHVPKDVGAPRAFYWMKAKPAGQPNAETVFVVRLPPNSRMVTSRGYYTLATARYVGSEAIEAFDLTFEPDVVAAEGALNWDHRATSIPGETFTIRDVPVR